MGSIIFDKGSLPDHLHEIIGYKAGITASIERLCDLLSGTEFPDLIQEAEIHAIRLRSEEYEELYYALIHKVGLTDQPYRGTIELFTLFKKLRELVGDSCADDIMNIYQKGYQVEVNKATREGRTSLDPSKMIHQASKKYGKTGLKAIILVIEEFERFRKLNPHTAGRWSEWKDIEQVENLFERSTVKPTHGEFFDQRFINFLSVNHNELGSIHWRKFEELTAECFQRFGFNVELGPGSNDDGVDVRVWKNDESSENPPEYIIQCKRQKEKIDKVTVKGLYADVQHEKSKMGLLVTTSEFSPGARSTISARGYPVAEVNGDMLKQWLFELRTPGTGIIRV